METWQRTGLLLTDVTQKARSVRTLLPGMLIGIEIGGTKLQLVRGDQTGSIVDRLKLDVSRAHGAQGIREQIKKALPKLMVASQIKAIGVGFGGPVDWKVNR